MKNKFSAIGVDIGTGLEDGHFIQLRSLHPILVGFRDNLTLPFMSKI